ncbi:MAG: redox-sensing transcriptional repressor Rex [Actinomycetota bacterium]|nr:redox-sensing transcriptional repressor Rex [Actinomycetota bacterium]
MRMHIPDATVARLPVYLRCLAMRAGTGTCSSEDLARTAGVNATQVRKDLSFLEAQGTRGVGYDVDDLRLQIREALGLTHEFPVVIVGAGNLGRALANYGGFGEWGFSIAAIVDVDARKVGSRISNSTVESMADLETIISDRGIEIGIIATPSTQAQSVGERLGAAGVRSILNLAPTVIAVDGVEVRRFDLSTELQILAYHLQEREATE